MVCFHEKNSSLKCTGIYALDIKSRKILSGYGLHIDVDIIFNFQGFRFLFQFEYVVVFD